MSSQAIFFRVRQLVQKLTQERKGHSETYLLGKKKEICALIQNVEPEFVSSIMIMLDKPSLLNPEIKETLLSIAKKQNIEQLPLTDRLTFGLYAGKDSDFAKSVLPHIDNLIISGNFRDLGIAVRFLSAHAPDRLPDACNAYMTSILNQEDFDWTKIIPALSTLADCSSISGLNIRDMLKPIHLRQIKRLLTETNIERACLYITPSMLADVPANVKLIKQANKKLAKSEAAKSTTASEENSSAIVTPSQIPHIGDLLATARCAGALNYLDIHADRVEMMIDRIALVCAERLYERPNDVFPLEFALLALVGANRRSRACTQDLMDNLFNKTIENLTTKMQIGYSTVTQKPRRLFMNKTKARQETNIATSLSAFACAWATHVSNRKKSSFVFGSSNNESGKQKKITQDVVLFGERLNLSSNLPLPQVGQVRCIRFTHTQPDEGGFIEAEIPIQGSIQLLNKPYIPAMVEVNASIKKKGKKAEEGIEATTVATSNTNELSTPSGDSTSFNTDADMSVVGASTIDSPQRNTPTVEASEQINPIPSVKEIENKSTEQEALSTPQSDSPKLESNTAAETPSQLPAAEGEAKPKKKARHNYQIRGDFPITHALFPHLPDEAMSVDDEWTLLNASKSFEAENRTDEIVLATLKVRIHETNFKEATKNKAIREGSFAKVVFVSSPLGTRVTDTRGVSQPAAYFARPATSLWTYKDVSWGQSTPRMKAEKLKNDALSMEGRKKKQEQTEEQLSSVKLQEHRDAHVDHSQVNGDAVKDSTSFGVHLNTPAFPATAGAPVAQQMPNIATMSPALIAAYQQQMAVYMMMVQQQQQQFLQQHQMNQSNNTHNNNNNNNNNNK